MDKTALSYWFPIIEGAGIPVPKTKIFQMPESARDAVWGILDGRENEIPEEFINQIAEAAKEFGYPCFLRTDHTSAKHSWKRSCYITSEESIQKGILSIAEFSECASFVGIPWYTWAIREYLPIMPHGICPRYGDMPVNKEFRFFVEDGMVLCCHPYWPLDALKDGGWTCDPKFTYEELCNTGDMDYLTALAEKTGEAVGGLWSIDILETEHGWFVTDMAEAHKSFHWESCTNKKR